MSVRDSLQGEWFDWSADVGKTWILVRNAGEVAIARTICASDVVEAGAGRQYREIGGSGITGDGASWFDRRGCGQGTSRNGGDLRPGNSERCKVCEN